ncbi:hypothetical protein [Methylobacter sp. S3L5C]|uniref:hypothetical protein n=1 Tax=Methylobacter sp. S3L5C TaxID=2839024 RepID=UPI001FADD5E2|nr:hypothetical protein [Methylobacter sp. S3L5C]UOA09096.1 hypothetical protein KKZ03_01875 [Methylobacter sp. S3L5C]
MATAQTKVAGDQVYSTSGKELITVSQVLSAGDNFFDTGDKAYPAVDHTFSAGGKACKTYCNSASPPLIPSPTPI